MPNFEIWALFIIISRVGEVIFSSYLIALFETKRLVYKNVFVYEI